MMHLVRECGRWDGNEVGKIVGICLIYVSLVLQLGGGGDNVLLIYMHIFICLHIS